MPLPAMRDALWFLEVVVERRYPLSLLYSPDIEIALNRAAHRLPAAAVRALLDDLAAAGLISIDDACYGLTPAGGALWESYVRPDWTRYIDNSFGCDPYEAEIICADRARAASFIDSPHQLSPPLPGTLAWDVLAPWQATYWKTLPAGHRARYRYAPDDRMPPITDAYRRWCDEMYEWFERVPPPGAK